MVGVVRLPNVPISNGTRSVSPIISVDRPGRDAQFLGHGLSERGANVLPNFHLAGANRDFAFLVEVQPCGDVLRQRFTGPATGAAGFLPGKKTIAEAEDHDAAAHEFEKIAPSAVQSGKSAAL